MVCRIKLASRSGRRISVREVGGDLHLGHLVRTLHAAATSETMESLRKLAEFADRQFEEIDASSLPAVGMPTFDRAKHWRFQGIGSWHAMNVQGLLEFLFSDAHFVQVGFQVAVHPAVFGFGQQKALERVLHDVLVSLQRCYPEPRGRVLISRGAKYWLLGDERTHCYMREGHEHAWPTVTCRFGDRTLWDSPEEFAEDIVED